MEKNKHTHTQRPGTVEFEDVNKLKNKNVRGLLRKRAKRYECKLI